MNAKGLFSFIAGAAAGAAVIWLLKTEEGQQKAEEIKQKAAAGLDGLENAVGDLKNKAEATAKAAVEAVEEKLGK